MWRIFRQFQNCEKVCVLIFINFFHFQDFPEFPNFYFRFSILRLSGFPDVPDFPDYADYLFIYLILFYFHDNYHYRLARADKGLHEKIASTTTHGKTQQTGSHVTQCPGHENSD